VHRVLIVEDQPPVASALKLLLEVHDLPAEIARNPEEALRAVRLGGVGVVVQDMNFTAGATTGSEGAVLFRALRGVDPELPVLLMTAFTSLETAVALVREGASDYFGKPWDDARLVAGVRRHLLARRERAEREAALAVTLATREALAARHDLRGLVYAADAMHRLVVLALRVAPADVPVLVTGPNGSGKELVAEIVQAASSRAGRPFVRVNAGALPDDLLESELFGAEAGAYTGAQKLRVGRFEAAHGGTLFLDEIGNLSPAGQAKLLRVLQSGELTRLGSNETRRADVRLICATNVDLARAIAEGRFREDLYFRLNVIELHVPPLSARREDILPIARASLAEAGGPFRFSAASEAALLAHDWPGNVRELRNRIQRAALVAPGEEIGPCDLGFDAGAGPAGSPAAAGSAETFLAAGSATGLAAAGKAEVEELLRRHGGSVSRAAATFGVSRQALYRRMERLGVVLERRPREE
jgi:DNA-binding NtrC family response regulator